MNKDEQHRYILAENTLAYDIIKAHGGDIKVKSTENEETEFIVHLLVNQNA